MQAIRTKFLCPTDTIGSRISAASQAGRIITGWDHRQNQEENHQRAAKFLAKRLKWNGKLVSGVLPDGSWAHVFRS